MVGLGVGGEWSIGHAMVAESVPPQLKGRASAFLQTGEPVGVVMAALCEFWIKRGRERRSVVKLLAVKNKRCWRPS